VTVTKPIQGKVCNPNPKPPAGEPLCKTWCLLL